RRFRIAISASGLSLRPRGANVFAGSPGMIRNRKKLKIVTNSSSTSALKVLLRMYFSGSVRRRPRLTPVWDGCRSSGSGAWGVSVVSAGDVTGPSFAGTMRGRRAPTGCVGGRTRPIAGYAGPDPASPVRSRERPGGPVLLAVVRRSATPGGDDNAGDQQDQHHSTGDAEVEPGVAGLLLHRAGVRLDRAVRPGADLADHGTARGRLRDEAGEAVIAVRLERLAVVQRGVHRVVVQVLQCRVDHRLALRRIDHALLLLVELLELRVAVEAVRPAGRDGARVLGGSAVTGEHRQRAVRVRAEAPVPLEHVVVALADGIGQGVLGHHADVDLDADVLQPFLNVLRLVLRVLVLRAGEQPQGQVLAVRTLTDATRAHLVAGLVQQRLGLVRIEGA